MSTTQNENLELLKIRDQIDSIDAELIPLLARRMQSSEQVARIKQKAGLPVFHPEREQAVLEKVQQIAGDYGNAAVTIYSNIMAVSRARQHQLLSGGTGIRDLLDRANYFFPPQDSIELICQGVPGAYSNRAANCFFSKPSLRYKETWREVFEEVKMSSSAFGVIPVENSEAGSVHEAYTLLMEYRFYIVGALGVNANHCLAACKGAQIISTVISHPQGLAQCSSYIEKHKYSQKEFSNTATAAQHVHYLNDPTVAAICTEEAADLYGLQILDRFIQNSYHNTTRFVLISKNAIIPKNANKISLCFSLPHQTGTLYSVLDRFAMNGLNLTKIESHPIPDSKFEYDFYLDFSGNLHTESTQQLISSLQDELPRFSFLGNYIELDENEKWTFTKEL